MSRKNFDLLVKQNETVADGELAQLIDHCQKILDEGREFNLDITMHLSCHESQVLKEPVRKLDVDVTPRSPLDTSWQVWLDAEKFPAISEWAEKQPTFQTQIEYTIGLLRREILERETMITKVVDHWLKPLAKEQANKIKEEVETKNHGSRPKARKA